MINPPGSENSDSSRLPEPRIERPSILQLGYLPVVRSGGNRSRHPVVSLCLRSHVRFSSIMSGQIYRLHPELRGRPRFFLDEACDIVPHHIHVVCRPTLIELDIVAPESRTKAEKWSLFGKGISIAIRRTPYSLTNETGHPRLFSAAGMIRRSGVPSATSSTSLVRIASLDLSRSLIATTNDRLGWVWTHAVHPRTRAARRSRAEPGAEAIMRPSVAHPVFGPQAWRPHRPAPGSPAWRPGRDARRRD